MTYIGAVGRRIHLGDEPLGPCSTSLGRGHFEPTPCCRTEGLASLASWGAAVEPPPSIDTSNVAVDLPSPVGSWGVAAKPPPTGTSGMAEDSPTPAGS